LSQHIDELYAGGAPEEQLLEDLKQLDNEMNKLGIRDNSHTKHTMPSLTLQKRAFDNDVKLKKKLLDLEKKKKTGIYSIFCAFPQFY